MSDVPGVAVTEPILDGTVFYRTEEDGETSTWKVQVGENMTVLQIGVPPTMGSVIEVFEGQRSRVVSIKDGLPIITGDLPVREKFDPRRVYETPNSTSVTFKRMDKDGKVVLWSYKINAEIKIAGKTLLERTDRQAQPTATKEKRLTQKVLASWLIAQNPDIKPKELTKELQGAFPEAQIGDRHGPHYLSLSRKGKLPEAPDEDPRGD